MTPTQLQHHTEQMEAHRAEFQKLWQGELLPRIVSLGGTRSIREMATTKDIAWHAFKAAKGLTT